MIYSEWENHLVSRKFEAQRQARREAAVVAVASVVLEQLAQSSYAVQKELRARHGLIDSCFLRHVL